MKDHWDKMVESTGECVQEFVEQEVRPVRSQLDEQAARIDAAVVLLETCEDMISNIASGHSDTAVDDPSLAAEFAAASAQAIAERPNHPLSKVQLCD